MLLFNFKKTIPNHIESPENAEWNSKLQLWVDSLTNTPLVNKYTHKAATNYGETALTETNEGIDQSESSMGTEYGETTFTKTHEGTDQSEGSQFMNHSSSSEA